MSRRCQMSASIHPSDLRVFRGMGQSWALAPALFSPCLDQNSQFLSKKNSSKYHQLVGGLEHFSFLHLLGITIPTDELIFFRGVGWNHQPARIQDDPRGAWPWQVVSSVPRRPWLGAWWIACCHRSSWCPIAWTWPRRCRRCTWTCGRAGAKGCGRWGQGPWVFVVAWSKVNWRKFKIWSKPTYLKILKITDETWLTGAVGFVEWTLIYGWKVWHVVSFYCLIGRSLNQGTSNGTSGKYGANYLEFCWSHCLCGVCFK